MATLTLTKIFINLLSTGAAVSAYSGDERERGHDMAGEVRGYAGGRQRSITTYGERGRFSFTLIEVPDADIVTLRSWIGQGVQVRDHRGQTFYGVYHGLELAEVKALPGHYHVAIALRTITYNEAV